MELTEDEIIQKYGKNCRHCNRNTLLPYEYEWTCFCCGYNVNKRKHELSKIKRKKNSLLIVRNMLKSEYFPFVWFYIKYTKVMNMMKHTKFYQH